MTYISPFAPETFPILPAVQGVRLASLACGIKYKGRDDVMLAVMDPDTVVAGVLTQSKTASANIEWARKCLPHGKARILIVNSGNANAFNGRAGEESVERIVAACKQQFHCDEQEIYPCATGVIGEPLPDDNITLALNQLEQKLAKDSWEQAAKAIMTTDTYAKGVSRTVEIDGKIVTLTGIVKGSGMIAPDMATLLGYIFTDVAIEPAILQLMVNEHIDDTFNAITVDSDTSTSDMLLVFATGKVENDIIHDMETEDAVVFSRALRALMQDLAHLVVKDGEGLTKFVTIEVKGAEHDKAAKTIAMAIANSPLVKTALAGEDPNWGRIVMAVGKSGEIADRDKLSVSFGGISIVENGQLCPDYEEAMVAAHMKQPEVTISVDLAIEKGSATVWTCDLTKEYISINADYRS